MKKSSFGGGKSNWIRQVEKYEREVIRLLLFAERSHEILGMTEFYDSAMKAAALGEKGEKLARVGVESGATAKQILPIAAACERLDLISRRLKSVTERLWGGDLKTFPVYRTNLTIANHEKEIEALAMLAKAMEGAEDTNFNRMTVLGEDEV